MLNLKSVIFHPNLSVYAHDTYYVLRCIDITITSMLLDQYQAVMLVLRTVHGGNACVTYSARR